MGPAGVGGWDAAQGQPRFRVDQGMGVGMGVGTGGLNGPPLLLLLVVGWGGVDGGRGGSLFLLASYPPPAPPLGPPLDLLGHFKGARKP